MSKTNLDQYKEKRDLQKSPEPEAKQKQSKKARFVIQKHDASNLHYDFRLEIDGVLKSWAIPKGPSTDPEDKRLAIPTEDHPLDYINFEGVIPEDQYGGGSVMVWDTGEFVNLKEDKDDPSSLKESYDDGMLELWLKGEKIYGGYALIKTSNDDNWLLIKMDDEKADARRNPTSTENKSVKSDRTLKEIEKKEQDD